MRAVPVLIWLVSAIPPAAPTLSVLSAGAVESAVVRLAERFERDVGHAVASRFGTGPEIEQQLSSGRLPDVLIAPAAVVERAVKGGLAMAGSETVIARVGVGIVVRRGVSTPRITTQEDLKAVLLGADSVVYNQASTGQYLESLFARMGIRDQLAGKTTRYANAAQVLEHLIAGKGNEIGFGPVTEIKSFEPRGVVLVGAIPAEIQNYTTYVAALMKDARAPDAGRQFIGFLTSAAGREAFVASGAQ